MDGCEQSTDLKNLSLQVLKCLSFDPACNYTREAQQTKDDLHLCSLCDQVLDGTDLSVYVIRSK